jgi:hypothetical protein
MSLVHLVYASSFIDEYGMKLPGLIEHFVTNQPRADLKLMTLFAHGDVMQLLEGNASAVSRAFRDLPIDAMQFGVTKLLSVSVKESCLQANCIGLAANSMNLITPETTNLDLFQLHPTGVDARIAECVSKKLMMGFAEVHQ